MSNRFLDQLNRQPQAEQPSAVEPSSNRFLSQLQGRPLPKKQESFAKEIGRDLAQIPLGALKSHKGSYGLDLLKLASEGASKNVLAELYENDPDFDMQIAEQARQSSIDKFPTQDLVEQLIEEKTGAPLKPKTPLQKSLRQAATGAGFRSGGALQKGGAGLIAAGGSKGLQALGVPEGISDAIGLGISGATPLPKGSAKLKPSGLKERRFEKVKKETKITPARHEIITKTVEDDFKKLSDQLLEKNKTFSAMKEDTLFKEKIGSLFEDVEHLSENVKGKLHTEDIKTAFKDRYRSRETKGISPDEFERGYRKEVKKIFKEIPYDEMTAAQGVQQFRKNNKSLRELFEPGKSSAFNRAKKEALLEYNRAIEDVFNKKYPDSEFKKLFEFTNKRWQEINDIEQIERTVGDIFSGKIDFGKAKQIFRKDKEHISRPFKRILGEEGFDKFKSLTEDLLSSEKPYKMLKKAEDAGLKDFVKLAGGYVLHPGVAKAQIFSKAAKQAYQTILDKPQLTYTWKSGLDSLKKGEFSKAEKEFRKLDTAVNQTNQKNQ